MPPAYQSNVEPLYPNTFLVLWPYLCHLPALPNTRFAYAGSQLHRTLMPPAYKYNAARDAFKRDKLPAGHHFA